MFEMSRDSFQQLGRAVCWCIAELPFNTPDSSACVNVMHNAVNCVLLQQLFVTVLHFDWLFSVIFVHASNTLRISFLSVVVLHVLLNFLFTLYTAVFLELVICTARLHAFTLHNAVLRSFPVRAFDLRNFDLHAIVLRSFTLHAFALSSFMLLALALRAFSCYCYMFRPFRSCFVLNCRR